MSGNVRGEKTNADDAIVHRGSGATQWVLYVVAAVLTVGTALVFLKNGLPKMGARGTATFTRMIGLRPTIPVIGNNGKQMQMASIGGERCSYVIVYRAGCRFSQANAAVFAATADKSGPLVPAGWTLRVLALDSLEQGHPLRKAIAAGDVFTLSAPLAEAIAAGIEATPMFLVLDRSGVVKSEGVGATLWRPAAYRPDCTIVKTLAESQ